MNSKLYSGLATMLLLFIIPFLSCSEKEKEECGDKVSFSQTYLPSDFSFYGQDYRYGLDKLRFSLISGISHACIYERVYVDLNIQIKNEPVWQIDAYPVFKDATPANYSMTISGNYYTYYHPFNLRQGFESGPGHMAMYIYVYVIADNETEAWEVLNNSIGEVEIEFTYYEHKD